MTAGRGIVHSERTAPDHRAHRRAAAWTAVLGRLAGRELEEIAPAFVHHDAAELPVEAGEGKTVRVIAGSLYGKTSPLVDAYTPRSSPT